METFKTILLFAFGLLFGFGFWYLIFWFITVEPNLFVWHWVTKIVYLFFSFASTSGVINGLLKD
jgi:hypothetical protein